MPIIDDMISQEEIDALLGRNYITNDSDMQQFKSGTVETQTGSVPVSPDTSVQTKANKILPDGVDPKAADATPETTTQTTQEKTKLDSARELRNNAHERLRTLYEKKNAVINGNNKAIYEARRKFSMQELKSIGATRMSDRIAATSGYLKDRFINGIKNIGVHAHNALQHASADDPEFKDLKKTRSVRERIAERQNSRLADAAFGKKINKAINARNDADNLYKRIKNHDPKYSEMEINEKTARKARQETIAARKGKLSWKGKAGAAAALLALGGVIGNQFSGGHQSNAQLYNPNPQPQYAN